MRDLHKAARGVFRSGNLHASAMTSFFVVPTFTPVNLEQLPVEPDEVSIIVAQEARVTTELTEVREYHRDAAPLGVIVDNDALDSEAEEGLTSDEGLTEEEDEELVEEDDEEGEGLDDDLGDGGDDM